jgi:threonine aldolase
MRQVGFAAAAGLYALDHNFERLSEDHKKALELGEVLSKMSSIKQVEPIETNIIIFELQNGIDESQFLKKLFDKHIHIIGMGSNKLRMVTHLDYTDEMHERTLDILSSI